MAKNLTLGALVVAVAVLGFVAWSASQPQLGRISTFAQEFQGGVTLGTQVNPTTLGFYQCATATVDPAAFTATTTGSGTVTTSAPIALTGATSGDGCVGSLTSATSTQVLVTCSVAGATGSTTLQVHNLTPGGSTLDLGSGTAKVCAFGPAR